MKQALIKIEITMSVDVDDSTTLEEATDIALFECGASSGVQTALLDKMQDNEIYTYEVLDSEFADM